VTHLLLLTTFILKKENSVYGSFSLALALLLREEPETPVSGHQNFQGQYKDCGRENDFLLLLGTNELA
jgi:hypothetical protein